MAVLSLFCICSCGLSGIESHAETAVSVENEKGPGVQAGEETVKKETESSKKDDRGNAGDSYAAVLEEIGISISDLVKEEEGEITENQYAYLRFLIREDGEEELRERLTRSCGEPEDIPADQLPGYMGHEIAAKMKSEELSGVWFYFGAGEGTKKTRSAELYLTKDGQGSIHLYFFG